METEKTGKRLEINITPDMKLLSQSELEILLKEKASIDYEKQWDDYKNNNSKKDNSFGGFSGNVFANCWKSIK
ncbi:MAG: hypothetical protein ACLVE0_12460 [Parabacteroides distasonis]|jgi:hypothetical protein|uniref:Uncharacterized protein n=1 Tax=Myoviridae sp. ctrCp2 TaxID=2825179 RepID=A0A8S5P161_9CAUD|nr:hypothetical protein [Parabacteroides distasonis]MCE9127284.1 hypothetical protein [Parabacteroides distasonis]MCE9130089.1 hypothetical protein [Parabacteroides distasonis]DAD99955.1 MAG TPA: hypothetical protein [Myoviridae sp. ctrCp2]